MKILISIFDTGRYLDFYSIFAIQMETWNFLAEISFVNDAESQLPVLSTIYTE